MSRFQPIFEHLKQDSEPSKHREAAERYVLRGDPEHLNAIKADMLCGWELALCKALPAPSQLQDDDRRVIQTVIASEGGFRLAEWLGPYLEQEKPDEDVFAPVRDALLAQPKTANLLVPWVGGYAPSLERADRPNSVGRFVLALSNEELALAAKHSGGYATANPWSRQRLIQFLLRRCPERVPALGMNVFAPHDDSVNPSIAALLLSADERRYLPLVAALAKKSKDAYERFSTVAPLAERLPQQFLADAEKAGLDVLQGYTCVAGKCREVTEWLVKHVGDPIIPKLASIMAEARPGCGDPLEVAGPAAEQLGKRALPILRSALQRDQPVNAQGQEMYLDMYYSRYLQWLLPIKEDQDNELILSRIRLLMKPPYGHQGELYFGMAMTSGIPGAVDLVASYLEDSAKTRRRCAVKALAPLGDEVLPRAEALLRHRKADLRETGIELLAAINSPRAKELLRTRLGEESTAKLCDLIRKALPDESAAPETRTAPRKRRSS